MAPSNRRPCSESASRVTIAPVSTYASSSSSRIVIIVVGNDEMFASLFKLGGGGGGITDDEEMSDESSDGNGDGEDSFAAARNTTTTSSSSSSMTPAVDEDDDGGGGGGDSVDIIAARYDQVAWLHSIVECARELMVNVWNVSPKLFDELQKIISQIGHNRQVTQLYELLFDADRWREAIEPFSEVVVVPTIFGWVTYAQRHRLDQLVFDVLAGQSLSVMYNTYQSLATNERLAMFTPVVTTLHHVRRFANMNSHRIVEVAESVKMELTRCGVKSLHALAFALLTAVDATIIRNFGHSYAKAVLRSTRDLADSLQRAQRTIGVAAAAASSSPAHHTQSSTETTTAKAQRSDRSANDDSSSSSPPPPPPPLKARRLSSSRCTRSKRRLV